MTSLVLAEHDNATIKAATLSAITAAICMGPEAHADRTRRYTAAVSCGAIYTVLGARLARRYTPLAVLTLANAGSLVVWLPILGWYVFSGRFPALSWAAILEPLPKSSMPPLTW